MARTKFKNQKPAADRRQLAADLGDEARIDKLIDELVLMFDYATSTGIQLDTSLRQDIAEVLASAEAEPEETVIADTDIERNPDGSPKTPSENSEPSPAKSREKEAGETDEEDSRSAYLNLILRVHNGLSTACAPATPISLEATRRINSWRINNPVVNGLIILTLANLVLFIIFSALNFDTSQDNGGASNESALQAEKEVEPEAAESTTEPADRSTTDNEEAEDAQ